MANHEDVGRAESWRGACAVLSGRRWGSLLLCGLVVLLTACSGAGRSDGGTQVRPGG